MGERNFAAQYLQALVPLEGGMLKWAWFGFYDEKPAPGFGDRTIMSWDTAMTDGHVSDYSVCTTWLFRKGQYFLLDVLRERLAYPDLKRRIVNSAAATRMPSSSLKTRARAYQGHRLADDPA